MKIYIGNDHAGVSLKSQFVAFFESMGHSVVDLGSQDEDAPDDYVDFAQAVGEAVVKSKGRSRGILLCGSGTGMAIAANKIKGVRAGLCYDTYTAKMARLDNDANVLCLRSRGVNFSKLAEITNIWLSTDFSHKARHKRRIQKIARLEK